MTGNSFRDRCLGAAPDPAAGSGAPPVIVIGMHRSGTTLVSRILERAGLFMGAEKDPNNESTYFMHLNNWLLNQAGATWQTPEPFDALLEQPALVDTVVDQMERMMTAPSAREFLGGKVRRGSAGIKGLESAWGWKDPRTTITLPIWLRVFPDARVVHVTRNGVDVAASLHVRSNAEARKWRQKLRLALSAMVTDSVRCMTLEGAFGLWLAYMQRASASMAGLGGRGFRIRYEDLLAAPYDQIPGLLDFCGLASKPEVVAACRDEFHADRAFAYRGSPELASFADAHHGELARHGYEP